MNIIKKITCMLWILAVLMVAPPLLRSFGLKPKDVLDALFAANSRPSSVLQKNVQSSESSAQHDDNSQRGHAQDLRPDISVPPPPEESSDSAAPTSAQDKKAFEDMISGLEEVASVASKDSSAKDLLEGIPVQPHRPADSSKKVRWSPPPPGFLTAETFNYLIYREEHPVTSTVKTTLDTIHGNLMLDLTPFTILIKPNKILVMIFGKKDSYSDFTKLPPWSGAASDLRSDTMYVVEGKSFYPLSVHELTHLYFDGYFLPTISPLWLSEGMAVYMQIHTTKQKPSWVNHSMKRIVAGDIIPLSEMTVTEDLSALSTSQAELWYTQAYSLVEYLLTKRTRDEFYKFANELKTGTPLHQALYRAYGMPFTKVSVLENVWLHDVQKAYKRGGDMEQNLHPAAAAAAATKKTPPQQGLGAPKPKAQKTQINKLEMVPTNGYSGGF
ncbi:MAG: peptidase MA family metallohydrolase [Candidatus Avelusimicrobium sp.]|uniref:peptidase MA family metallohydrolase n=1 Tax=Candidatus Avelusimicrobium sp. TaxID=3048833 RepID=UPI003F0EEC95